MFLKLMYITISVDVALIAEIYGVDRFRNFREARKTRTY